MKNWLRETASLRRKPLRGSNALSSQVLFFEACRSLHFMTDAPPDRQRLKNWLEPTRTPQQLCNQPFPFLRLLDIPSGMEYQCMALSILLPLWIPTQERRCRELLCHRANRLLHRSCRLSKQRRSILACRLLYLRRALMWDEMRLSFYRSIQPPGSRNHIKRPLAA